MFVRTPLVLVVLFALVGLSGCQKPTTEKQTKDQQDQKIELKVVKPVSTDASSIAAETYQFLLKAEQATSTLDPTHTSQFDQQIFNPVNTLLTRWRLEVKQSDSVAGDQYTICRGALISLDAWARSVIDQSSSMSSKKEVFENQKKLCGQQVNPTK